MHHDFGTVPATGVTDQQQQAALRTVGKAADDGGWTAEETLDVLQAIGLVDTVPGGYRTPLGRWRPRRKAGSRKAPDQ